MGGLEHPFQQKGDASIKHSHDSGDLVPHPGTLFFARVLYENFWKVPEQFRHPLKNSGRVPKPFWLDGLLRNNFLVSLKFFWFSLRNIFGVSETFSVTFS